jgi:hypothetical protein
VKPVPAVIVDPEKVPPVKAGPENPELAIKAGPENPEVAVNCVPPNVVPAKVPPV